MLFSSRRGTSATLLPQDVLPSLWEESRFAARAHGLFHARLVFLSLGMLVLLAPEWRGFFRIGSPWAYGIYAGMWMYTLANQSAVKGSWGRGFTYVTLCVDLAIAVVLVASPVHSGGLQSPLLATQLLFTALFAILFPTPLAILPPLMALPIVVRLDLLLSRPATSTELLTVGWYAALNLSLVLLVVRQNQREAAAQTEVLRLQEEVKLLAATEERTRISRDIHDGVGASLSSLILQAEYLLKQNTDPKVRTTIEELKTTAEESMEELRRSLKMMRDNFDLHQTISDYLVSFEERTRIPIRLSLKGTPLNLGSEKDLAVFRLLQEGLANAAKHSFTKDIAVELEYGAESFVLGIHDSGRGFDAAASEPGHYGLKTMSERALQVGGELELQTGPGRGTHLTAKIPLGNRP